MNYEHLKLERRATGVALLTLDRPEAANALHLPLARELHEAVMSCEADPQIRALLLTGAGRFFCGGGDLGGMAGGESGEQDVQVDRIIRRMTLYLHGTFAMLLRGRLPVVAAINGPAAGIGLSLAVLADFSLAAQSARFSTAYGAIGLSPDGGCTWLLPRLVGMARARELILGNRRLDATEAQAWGLITAVHPDAELMTRAEELAARLAKGPTLAYAASRSLLMDSFMESLEGQMEKEARLIAQCAASPDGKEGIQAFRDKRPPQFQ